MVDTLLNIAMMHSDTLVTRAKEGDQSAQGKLVQLWYKRIYNFGYKFFMDHDLAMEVVSKDFYFHVQKPAQPSGQCTL